MRKNFIFAAIGIILFLLIIIGTELYSLREESKITSKAREISCFLKEGFNHCSEDKEVSEELYELISSLPETSDTRFDLDTYVVKMSKPNHPIYIYDNNTGYFLYSVDLNKDGTIKIKATKELSKISK